MYKEVLHQDIGKAFVSDMSYTLTLSHDALMALDWLGARYESGRLPDMLAPCQVSETIDDVTYAIPESVAWDIAEAIRNDTEDYRTQVPCCCDALSFKLIDFAMSIV